jgi:predicted Zn-dependent peptidase
LAFTETPLGSGASLYLWSTPKFKTTTVRLLLRMPLGEDASAGALLPMILQRGTRNLPETIMLSRKLDMLYGAELRADVLKLGEEQVSIFHLEVADAAYLGGEDPLPEALGLLGDMLADPPLEADALRGDWVGQERDNLRRRIQGIYSDKAHYAQLRLIEEMCPGEPYATPRLGRLEDLERQTGESLWRRWQGILLRAPLAIYMVGDIDPRQAQELAHRLVQRIGRREAVWPPPVTPHPVPRAPKEVHERQAVAQGKLALGFTTALRASDPAYPALAMMNGVYGGFSHSRLFQEVRERHSLCYYAQSQIDGVKGFLFVHLGVAPATREAAQALVLQELDVMRRGGFRPQEVADTLRGIQAQIEQSADAPSEAIMTDFELRAAGRPTVPEQRIAALTAVSPDEIAEAARGLTLDTVYFLDGEEVTPDGTH